MVTKCRGQHRDGGVVAAVPGHQRLARGAVLDELDREERADTPHVPYDGMAVHECGQAVTYHGFELTRPLEEAFGFHRLDGRETGGHTERVARVRMAAHQDVVV